MSYSIIALDLDGTLTNSRKELTDITRDALFRVMDSGAKVVLASGRPTYGIAPLAEKLEMAQRGGYVMAFNGGVVTDWKTKKVIYSKTLPHDVLPALAEEAHRAGVAIVTYKGDTILTERPDDEYVQKEAFINQMKVRKVDDFLTAIDFDPAKCLIAGQPSILAPLCEEMQKRLEDKMEVYRSAPYFIELVPKGIDKALSLGRLLGELSLSPADMIAFGDGYNDLSMLRLAGMGVAMGNAEAEVRAAADYITDTNDRDGVAKALERFFPQAFQSKQS